MSQVTRVIVVSAVYPPEPVVSAQMSRDLARSLSARDGVDVTVLCPFPTRPIGAVHGGLDPGATLLARSEDGFTVVRLPSFTHPESSVVGRMRESLSFGMHVRRYLKRLDRQPDLVYANTWPVASQTPIARHCAKHGIPLIWHVQDLYPETLLARLPRAVTAVVSRPLTAHDSGLVHNAAHTVVISEHMRQTYMDTRRLPRERVTRISNWVDETPFDSDISREEACARYGVPPEPFTFLYLGNIGPLAGVEYLIESFARTEGRHLQLVVAGDGSRKRACVELAQALGDDRVLFVSDPDVANVPVLQAMGHVCLLPLKAGSGGSSVPSKLMAYVLSGRPVLATVDSDSDTARVVREAECGWIGPPEDQGWLTEAMLRVAQIPSSELAGFGQRGRAYGLREYSRTQGVERLADLVLEHSRAARSTDETCR